MGQKRERVLLLDGDAAARELVRVALWGQASQMEPQDVCDEAGLARVLESGEFDVVLTVQRLAWGAGVDVLRRAKSARPDAPVFLLTDAADVAVAVEAIRTGFDDCIPKDPHGLGRLAESVLQALRRSRDAAREPGGTSAVRFSARRVVHASPIAMCILDEDGTVRAWNASATSLFGRTEEEVLGQPFPFLTPEEMWNSFSSLAEAAGPTEPVYAWKEQRRGLCENLVEMDLFATPLPPSEDESQGILVVAVPPTSDRGALSDPWRGLVRQVTPHTTSLPPPPAPSGREVEVAPLLLSAPAEVEEAEFDRNTDFGPVTVASPRAGAKEPSGVV